MRHKFAAPQLGWAPAIAVNVTKGMIVAVPSVLAMDGLTWKALLDMSGCLMAVLVATALFHKLQPALSNFPVDGPRWVRQAATVTAASALALLGSLRTPT